MFGFFLSVIQYYCFQCNTVEATHHDKPNITYFTEDGLRHSPALQLFAAAKQ